MHTFGYETFVLQKNDKELINMYMNAVEEKILSDPYNDYCIIQPLERINDVAVDKETALEIADRYYNKVSRSLLVPFYRQRSAKLKALEERLEKETMSLEEYRKSQSIKNRKSKSVTCEKCDSRLTITWLKGNNCPVCGNLLLSKTVSETILKKEEVLKKLSSDIKIEMKESKDKKNSQK